MIYVLIFISLTLATIVAFQFLYIFFLQTVEKEHKNLIREIERERKKLQTKLSEAEQKLAQYPQIIGSINESDDEVWSDLIVDH